MSKKLQNVLPYVFPLIAIAFVLIMFVRWYQTRTAEAPTGLLDPELMVESLPADVQNSIVRGTADYDVVAMSGDSQAMGEVRYQLADDKVSFTVTANLPTSQEEYAVWLTDLEGQTRKRVFNLVYSKAGYVGSALVTADVLPVKVVVSKASDLLLQDSLLEAELRAE